MNYLITKNVIVDETQYRVGLYRVDDQWRVDTDYFGGMPVDALRGKLADVVDSAIKGWESV
jgi:hypothetical protein